MYEEQYDLERYSDLKTLRDMLFAKIKSAPETANKSDQWIHDEALLQINKVLV